MCAHIQRSCSGEKDIKVVCLLAKCTDSVHSIFCMLGIMGFSSQNTVSKPASDFLHNSLDVVLGDTGNNDSRYSHRLCLFPEINTNTNIMTSLYS